MVEVIVIDYCRMHSIPLGVPDESKLLLKLNSFTAPADDSSLPEAERGVVSKSRVVSVRVAPLIKAALQAAADRELRSLANMMEVMVVAYCRANGIRVIGLSEETLPQRKKEHK